MFQNEPYANPILGSYSGVFKDSARKPHHMFELIVSIETNSNAFLTAYVKAMQLHVKGI